MNTQNNKDNKENLKSQDDLALQRDQEWENLVKQFGEEEALRLVQEAAIAMDQQFNEENSGESVEKSTENEPVKSNNAWTSNNILTWIILLFAIGALAYMFLSVNESNVDTKDNTEFTQRFEKIEKSVAAIDNRVGKFSGDDKESISEKIGTINQNQELLQNEILAVTGKVEHLDKEFSTVTKKLKSVSNQVYVNTKRSKGNEKRSKINSTKVIAITKTTKGLVEREKATQKRVAYLNKLVEKLKKEECTRTFRMNDTDLCK